MYCTESFGVFDISYISRTSAWNSPKTLHSIVPDIKNCRFNFDFNFSRGHLSDAIQTMLFQLRYLKDTVASFMMVTSLYLLNIKAMGYNKNYEMFLAKVFFYSLHTWSQKSILLKIYYIFILMYKIGLSACDFGEHFFFNVHWNI